MSAGEERNRTVRLLCPSLSKAITVLATDDHRIDLGHIARTFGLVPTTVKLNGHFIARGADLVASSVTWRSLLSFFASRGLPAGGSDCHAILVQGKLQKAGTKRLHDLDGSENEINYACCDLRQQLADFNLSNIKKLKGNTSGFVDPDNEVSYYGLSLKRKHQQEDLSPLKRLAIR